MAKHRTVPANCWDLDRVLLHPDRLFIASLLAGMEWCESAEIQNTVGMTSAGISPHLAQLRRAGYVETRREGLSSQSRITLLGCERFANHLAALASVVSRAAEIISSRAALARTLDCGRL
ncbi:MAG: transcriptional regulator [Amycolatopsis sp.]|uniref:transcriptional regulator n=1 Tax=Amycolatopsis sp. TaxID=37632 RepID=UPI002626CF5F|nr:transcriptional regulator [Amycolatopsis sp.]MCU1687734.1 transcriptional regulator [Amycolatopsis sp.]